MKKVLASVCSGAVLVVLLAGCDPHLAQIQGGTQEELWYKQLKSNYPSFTPPRHPAPAVYTPTWQNYRQSGVSAPADDPENTVDNAADGGKVTNLEDAAPAPQNNGKADKGKEPGAAPVVAEPEVNSKAVKDAPKAEGTEEKAADAEGKIYIVQSGDTLSGIAKKFYGKGSLEDVIFRANSKVLKDRNTLSVGMRLVIPEL